MSLPAEAIQEFLETVKEEKLSLQKAKAKLAQRYGLRGIPSHSQLLQAAEENPEALKLLRRKEIRRASGVLVVAVMTKPYPCPHGHCAYCPGGPSRNTPQSYTGREPAALRGIQNSYDPRRQVESRLRQFKALGHPLDKVELIIMGGTFPSFPPDYQDWFVKGCLEALAGVQTRSLEEAVRAAEQAPIRNTAITVETRPDWAKEPQVDRMLRQGVTRVEIGVQTLHEEVYRLVDRGHSLADVVEATRILKDAGMKVCYHMMPGLPTLSVEDDLEDFRKLFSEADYRPDMLKIYPTLVLEGTRLHELWLRGEYQPYTVEDAVKLLVEVKPKLPRWVRIQRIQRDIPAQLIVAGVKAGNLRELVQRELARLGLRCRCIRCREAGHVELKKGLTPNPDHVKLTVERYEASEGIEYFLSFEDVVQDILVAWLRLRLPSEKAHRPEVKGQRAAIVRELHVSGPMVPRGVKAEEGWQHRGYGRSLLQEAERIAREELDAKKLVVNSAIGVREYYFRLGYRRDGPYMSKPL